MKLVPRRRSGCSVVLVLAVGLELCGIGGEERLVQISTITTSSAVVNPRCRLSQNDCITSSNKTPTAYSAQNNTALPQANLTLCGQEQASRYSRTL